MPLKIYYVNEAEDYTYINSRLRNILVGTHVHILFRLRLC